MVFIYAVLSLHHMLVIPTAAMVAASTLVLRVFLDYFFWTPSEYFSIMLAHQYSGAVYFLTLALILRLSGIKKLSRRLSLRLALLMLGAVSAANLVEALVRVPALDIVSAEKLLILVLMSAVQVFLVSSFIHISSFQQLKVLDEQERVGFERMLLVASELYDELFYMKKTTENIENVMAKSYDLHRRLKELKFPDRSLGRAALEIAEEVHEVKKDTVRLLAGLSGVLKLKRDPRPMYLSELLDLVVRTNSSYSRSLEKKIQFHLQLKTELKVAEIYPLLAILNNLVANAIEAIQEDGYIVLKARRRGKILRLSVHDNGVPIRERDRALIFEPGFTTKFSPEGVPSTGLGLAYVKGLVESFRGRVCFRERLNEKCFMILLPARRIAGGCGR